MKNIRINSIECRRVPCIKGKLFYEIIKWETNPHYKKEEELIKDGYEWSIGGEFLQKDNKSIDKNCFKNPETCYVIAWLNIDNEGVPYIKTVGDRLLDLNGAELYSFMEVYRRADEKLKQKYNIIEIMNKENKNIVTLTNDVEAEVVAEVKTDYGDFVITVDDYCYLILRRLENGKYEPRQYIEKEFHDVLRKLPSLSNWNEETNKNNDDEIEYKNKYLDINPYSTEVVKKRNKRK